MMNESRERIRREREREKNTYTSPRLALRRVLLLSEGRQFREAAAIVSRLGPGVLGSVATELPIDLLVESLPHSAHLLETLLNRLITLEISPRPDVQCEAIVWRLVALLGSEQGPSFRAGIAKLAAVLQQYNPDLKETVDARRRQLDAAVHGLGTHGLTADSSGTLISLHAALKTALQQYVEVYKQALHKLEELSPVTVCQEPASSSHQRLLSLSHGDVERRLIDNKSLLTAVDKPTLQLPALLAALASRVDADKRVLAAAGLLRRCQHLDLASGRPIAGVLMSYSRGCAALLGLMSAGDCPPPRSPPDSLSDGYHSDSDDVNVTSDRRDTVGLYAAAWRLARTETLPALAALAELRAVPTLKYKIVFSVAVLSFRAAVSLRQRRMSELRTLLGATESGEDDSNVASAVAAAARVLQDTAMTYCLREQENQVINQVLSTLREYPCLAGCAPLRALSGASCRAAWLAATLPPPLALHTDFTPAKLNPSLHTRLPRDTSEPRELREPHGRGDHISTFVWPALLHNNKVVFKAVVIT